MTAISYTAETPTGTVTRTSTSGRTYTHAIIALDKNGWGAVAWAGREDLAVKQVNHWSKVAAFTEVRMVPAVVVEKKPRTTKAELEMIASAVERAQADAPARKARKVAAKKAPAKKAEKVAADSPERKAERKLVEAGRKAGVSWHKLAEQVGMSGMGLRNRYIDLVPSK